MRATRADQLLTDFVAQSRRLLVLTGAGCSTDSGIPDYRDADGEWKHSRPVMFQDFVASHAARQRYWARSLIGWRRFAGARPNNAHRALAALEAKGPVSTLVTQNVDGLHRRAGSHNVIDLHGRLAQVSCLGCGERQARAALQRVLDELNPDWAALDAPVAPDGDVRLNADFEHFVVPACNDCGGLLKPDVVFFGESVPRDRVTRSQAALAEADALLVVGSSLMVWSGLRFVRAAAERGIPRALLNLGRTRADELFTLTLRQSCSETLRRVAARLGCSPAPA